MNGLFAEMKRRNVFRVGIAYLALAWFVIQLTDMAVPALLLPDWVPSLVFFLGAIGFPFALFFAWAFELTPEGLMKTEDVDKSQSVTHSTGRRLDFFIIGFLVLALLFVVWDSYLGPPVDTPDPVDPAPVAQVEPAADAVTNFSIAVLPFVNMSSDAEQEYFSDGISEEILNVLAKIPNLHVTSRSSSFAFKGKDLDLTKVAAQLGVAHILEGSVRKSGTKVRITAQLIEAETDRHLWSETYDRELVDVFAIQDELSAAIVAALKVTLLVDDAPADPSGIAKVNPEAYTAYLRGMHKLRSGSTIEDRRMARVFLEQSIALDSQFARAHVALADTLGALTSVADIPLAEGSALARATIERAIALDPDLAEAFATRAGHKMGLDFDFVGAREDLEHALKLNPNSTDVWIELSNLSTMLSQHREALREARRAAALDPVSPYTFSRLSRALFYGGRFDDAREANENALSLAPNHQTLLLFRAYIELALGNDRTALAITDDIQDEAYRPQIRAMAQFSLGNLAASDQALATLIRDAADDSAFQIAEAYCYRGDLADCLDWLDNLLYTAGSGHNRNGELPVPHIRTG